MDGKQGSRLRADIVERLPSMALDTRIPAGMTSVVYRKMGGMVV